MGTSQQSESKLGTGPQLKPDSKPELTLNSLHGISGSSFFPKLKIKKFKFESFFFLFLTGVRYVISFKIKLGFGIITSPIF
jgi:hypothetical protein